MPFAVIMIASFSPWKSSLESLASLLLFLHLENICLLQQDQLVRSRSYVGLQGISQLCVK